MASATPPRGGTRLLARANSQPIQDLNILSQITVQQL
jgi:hypothetical protein